MNDDKIFRPVDFDNLDFFDTSLSNPIHLGFVVDRQTAFLLPNVQGDRHEDSLYFLLRKKYGEEYKKLFSLFVTSIKEYVPDNMGFLDSKELTYAFFLACMGKIVYINTGDFSFSSGLLIVPDEESDLSNFQQEYLNKIIQKIPKEDEFEISKVSSIFKTIDGEFYYTEDTISSYLHHAK